MTYFISVCLLDKVTIQKHVLPQEKVISIFIYLLIYQ